MSTKTSSNGSTGGTAGKRFELPALEFKFGSLTDGTDIPPPLPSPKEEVPPPSKSPAPEVVEEKKEANGAANGHGTSPKSDFTTIPPNIGIKRPADDGPASPALSSRGSLRRLLSRTLLNNAYDEQGSLLSHNTSSRPPSRTASVLAEERKSKRSSGWFKRLRSHDPKRESLHFEEVKKPTGPPPPMIPELSALESKVDTRLGDDLFKGIK